VNAISRRSLLKALLGGAVQAAATVVLARAVPAAEAGESTPEQKSDLLSRADRLAQGLPAEASAQVPTAFVNGGFRNGGGGGFRNGGFANGGGGGGFRKGGFANGGGGGFKNGGFANGGGGGFRNSTFRNY
jgi:hypothetical protein